MSFSDIFKKSFLEGFSTDHSIVEICVCLGITAVIGLYVFFAYRFLTRKSFYDKNFNISLPVIAVITAGIILTIQSSIVISLGMVGALSIVRFRTAVKDAMDLVFLFWAISMGIICGAGLADIAIIVSLVLTAGILLLEVIPVARAPKLLVVNANNFDLDTEIIALVKSHSKYHKIKSRNLSDNRFDMVIEVRPDNEGQLVRGIMGIDGVLSASLLAHDGEVTF